MLDFDECEEKLDGFNWIDYKYGDCNINGNSF